MKKIWVSLALITATAYWLTAIKTAETRTAATSNPQPTPANLHNAATNATNATPPITPASAVSTSIAQSSPSTAPTQDACKTAHWAARKDEYRHYLAQLPELAGLTLPLADPYADQRKQLTSKTERDAFKAQLKQQANAGDPFAQAAYADYLRPRKIETPEELALEQEREQYLIAAAANGHADAAFSMAIRYTPTSLPSVKDPRLLDQIDAIAWHLIATKMGHEFTLLPQCLKQELDCSAANLAQGFERAKVYIELYGFKRKGG